MRISKVGVIGAGVMGHGIAALCASAGIPVVLLDIPGSDDPKSPDRSAPAKNGLLKAIKSKPASFMDNDRAALVTTGNTEDDIGLLADCDWIVEVIIEQPKPKQELFAKIEAVAPNAIVTSNTSGIPMSVLLQGRTEKFRRQFCGTHYFNPPRYMHLLEIIPTPYTAPDVLDAVRHFQERILGKGIVIAKDVPGFVANRLGVHGMVTAGRFMMEFDLTISEVDTLTGALIARAKTATFRTGDLSGIDVLVARHQRAQRSDRRRLRARPLDPRPREIGPPRRQDQGGLLQQAGQGHPHAQLEDARVRKAGALLHAGNRGAAQTPEPPNA